MKSLMSALGLVGLLFMCYIILTMASCTNVGGAEELLRKEGYTDVEITGYRFFDCSKDDTFHTGFKAKKNGNVITGVVCEGLLKGKTIRYD